MRSHFPPSRLIPLFSGLPIEQIFEEISFDECPHKVLDSVSKCVPSGRIARILVERASRRYLFFVEVELPGNRECKLQISDDGELHSRIDGMRKSELPQIVNSTVTHFLKAGARFDTAERVFTVLSEEFHVQLDLGNNLDLHLFLDQSGALLRRHEVGDY